MWCPPGSPSQPFRTSCLWVTHPGIPKALPQRWKEDVALIHTKVWGLLQDFTQARRSNISPLPVCALYLQEQLILNAKSSFSTALSQAYVHIHHCAEQLWPKVSRAPQIQ
jgi:hypothetical protein